MTLKDATANSLLMFVAATCVVLIVKAISPVSHSPQGAAGGQGGGGPTLTLQDGVHVYYIHGNFRCSTCQSLEAYAQEAVQTGFPEELSAGRIEWHAINYEVPGNERYAVDYEVVAPSVILAKFEGGQQVEWKGLHEIWELVDDKDAFLNYVQGNLREFMGEAPTPLPGPTSAPATIPARPVLKSPIPEASVSDMPISDSPESELPIPEGAEARSQLPDTASVKSPEPSSPLGSPATSPESFLPIPE